MPEPNALLDVARLLAAPEAEPTPTEEQVRRAVSTAYHAVFHKISRAGATRFMRVGQGSRASFAPIYRSYNHGRIRTVCTAILGASLNENLRRRLRTESVSQNMRDFARSFLELQGNRHRADYDPHAAFSHPDAVRAVDLALPAFQAFDGAYTGEQAGILAPMLANTRD